jgi:hypothetical protein
LAERKWEKNALADLYNLTVADLKDGELNAVLIKVHELQIEILRKKILV